MATNEQRSSGVSKGLSVVEIVQIEHELCRARLRPEYFRKSRWGAVGLFVRRVLERRNSILQQRGGIQLRQSDLAAACSQFAPAGAVSEFLNGNTPGDTVWGPLALRLLEFILGTGDSDAGTERHLAVDRFLRFFFANNPDMGLMPDHHLADGRWDTPARSWYFDGSIPDHFLNTRELLAEWRHIIQRVRDNRYSDVWIARVECGSPLQLVDVDGLTPSGAGLRDLLVAGVRLVFVVPHSAKFSAEPRLMAESFHRAITRESGPEVAKRVGVKLVDPLAPPVSVQSRWRLPSEYLHRHLNYYSYHWHDHGQELHRVYVARHPRHGPAAFQCDADECRSFREWETLFLTPKPRIRSHGKLNASSPRKRLESATKSRAVPKP